jgi:hypothetical protein
MSFMWKEIINDTYDWYIFPTKHPSDKGKTRNKIGVPVFYKAKVRVLSYNCTSSSVPRKGVNSVY